MKAYEIKLTLKEVEPVVWRKIIVPAAITFKRLHDTIQYAMGNWLNCHLHSFEFDEGKIEFTNNEEACEDYKYYNLPEGKKSLADMGKAATYINTSKIVKKSSSAKIDKYIEKYKSCNYYYDFGDGWEVIVVLISIKEDYLFGYPVLLDGKGDCPPDNCGGPFGYMDFLEAWNDTKHPEHKNIRIWGKEQFFSTFDIKQINKLMAMMVILKKVSKTEE